MALITSAQCLLCPRHSVIRGGESKSERENEGGTMKKGLPYMEESTENTTDLYKMGTLVS